MTRSDYHVVLIDDDPEFLTATEMFLRSEGFRVHAHTRAKQALQLIRRLEPDAVLLDQDMPETTGLEILRRLRRLSLTRSVPVLFLTASRDPELVSRGFRAGLDDYISKPFRGEELVLRLRAVIQRCRAAGPRGSDADTPPAGAGERILIFQTTHFTAFERSDHEARAELRGARGRLLHRLGDILVPGDDTAPMHRRDGITLLFPREVREDRIGRALRAANRLPVLNLERDFLAPTSATDPALARFPWPRFRLLDVRLSAQSPRSISKLLESLALELEDGGEDYLRVDF